jgi:hypothetical protein
METTITGHYPDPSKWPLCVDCRHFTEIRRFVVVPPDGIDATLTYPGVTQVQQAIATCHSPKRLREPVYGGITLKPCAEARHDDSDCRPDGRWFEGKAS